MAPPPVPFFHPRKNPAKTPPQGGAGLSKVMIVPAITRKKPPQKPAKTPQTPRKKPPQKPRPQGGAGLSKVMIVPAITRKTNEIPRNPPRPNGIRPRPHTIKFKKISIFG